MEAFLIKAAQLILALMLLVIIHEFGHFIFARMFGIRVEKFYIFFDPWFSLFKWKPKKSQTEYGIGWIPLGGYVKIAGMIDESMDKEQMAQPAQPDEFRSKAAWKRLLVMIAGVLFNFILAIIIYAGIAWYWGERTIPLENAYEGFDFTETAHNVGFRDGDIIIAADHKPIDSSDRTAVYKMLDANVITVVRGHADTIDINLPEGFIRTVEQVDKGQFMALRVPVFVKRVSGGGPAAKAGIEAGDRIIGVDSLSTPSFSELSPALSERADTPSDIVLLRGGDTLHVEATPNGAGKLGFELMPPHEVFDVVTTNYGIFASIPVGIGNGTDMMVTYVSSLKHLFSKQGVESIGGFGSIGNLFPEKWNWRTFWEMTAFLSIILAFMNIIPIPALDGGHVMFLLWEVVTGRKPSDKFLEYAQMAGMCFLIALLLYANLNDIFRLVIK